jgi:phosphoribosylanthranilate isomerase
MVRVKICGMTNWEDVQLAVDLGVSMIGLNFFPKSPRYIPHEKAAAIVRRLRPHVQAIGVFVNEAPKVVRKIADEVGLRAAQLHGDESPETVAEIARSVSVIKAFRVGSDFELKTLADYRATAFLLDGFSKSRRGGTGKSFDWKIARRAGKYGPIFVAGGITPKNVVEAIRTARPFAVDVCSGVEASPGKKDPKLMLALVAAVAAAEKDSE